MEIKPVAKSISVVDNVIQNLCDYILGGLMNGSIKQGDKIPSERELSEQLNIGRSTLREAIKVLVMLGLLEIRKGQGTYISDGNSGFYTEPLAWGLIIGYKSIEEIIEMRVILESEAARLATQKGDKKDMEAMAHSIKNMTLALVNHDPEAFISADVSLHMVIAEAAHNSAIIQMIKTIRRLLKIWIEKVIVDDHSMEITIKEHEDIYKSIMLGDSEGAYLAMRKHIEAASNRLKKVSK